MLKHFCTFSVLKYILALKISSASFSSTSWGFFPQMVQCKSYTVISDIIRIPNKHHVLNILLWHNIRVNVLVSDNEKTWPIYTCKLMGRKKKTRGENKNEPSSLM